MTDPANTIGNWTKEMDALLLRLIESRAKVGEFLAAFPSKSLNDMRLRAHRLNVNLQNMPLTGKVPRGSISKPESDDAVPPKVRNCMTCGAKFESFGPGNRLCNTHRRHSDNGDYAVRAR
jgi:hypothetical protein